MVDLVSNKLCIYIRNKTFYLFKERSTRRVLRPRTEPKSYAEAPDIVIQPFKVNGKHNGNYDSGTDDDDMPPLMPIKVVNIIIMWHYADILYILGANCSRNLGTGKKSKEIARGVAKWRN